MEKERSWKIKCNFDGRIVEGAEDVLRELYKRSYDETYWNGPKMVIYVKDVDPENREVWIGYAQEFGNVRYTWTKDYNSPTISIWEISRYVWDIDGAYWDEERGMWDDNGELVDEDEFVEAYASAWASEEADDFKNAVLETVKEICEYEGWE